MATHPASSPDSLSLNLNLNCIVFGDEPSRVFTIDTYRTCSFTVHHHYVASRANARQCACWRYGPTPSTPSHEVHTGISRCVLLLRGRMKEDGAPIRKATQTADFTVTSRPHSLREMIEEREREMESARSTSPRSSFPSPPSAPRQGSLSPPLYARPARPKSASVVDDRCKHRPSSH